MPGPRRKKPPAHHFDPLVLPDHYTEAYMQDWVNYGFELLCGMLAKHAQFAEWLDKHHRNEVA